MSGIEFCQRVRKEFIGNPPYILLLTSRTATQDIVAELKNGANDYIAKPFDNDELNNKSFIAFQENDKLYAYSDGIIETTNSNNKMFAQTRLITSISEMLSHDKNIEALQGYTDKFRRDPPT